MEFIYQPSDDVIRGKHVYRKQDYAFDFEPAAPEALANLIGFAGIASVSANEVQLEMDLDTGRLLYAWGFCPWMGWQDTDTSPEDPIVDGRVYVLGHELPLGAHRHIPPSEEQWRVMINRSSGWVILATPTNDSPEVLVRIADGCILGLKGTDMVTLWIHAEMQD